VTGLRGHEQPGTGHGERVGVVHHANVAIVRLGALCELESSTPSQANFRVSEYAVLDDGSEIVLHSERGYSAGVPRREQADVWQHMTAEGIERDVLTVVLPDDAEETGEDHPWDWLVALLARAGVVESADRLRTLPYEVRLGPAVMTRLGSKH